MMPNSNDQGSDGENKMEREWRPIHIASSTIGAVLVGASLIFVYLKADINSLRQIMGAISFILFCLGFASGILITLGFSGRKKPPSE